MRGGSNIEFVSKKTSSVCGSEDEFGNDYNTAQYNAMFDYNSSLLNLEDGSDTPYAQTLDSVVSSFTSGITNSISNLTSISDLRTTDTSGADAIPIPNPTGNFLTDLGAYSAYAAQCNAQVIIDSLKEKTKVQFKIENKMKSENIRQTLYQTIDFNCDKLQNIDSKKATKLKEIVRTMDDEELILEVMSSAADNIIIDGEFLQPIPGRSGLSMFFAPNVRENMTEEERLECQAEIQNYQLDTLVKSITG